MGHKNTSKYDYDFAKKVFRDKGYKLLETEYKNTRTKMRYRCPSHPDKELYSTLDNIMQVHGCIYCAKRATYSYDEVKQIFNSRGYELIDKKYKNAQTPMRYRCPAHPAKNTKISVSNLLQGHGCKYCVSKYTYEEVKNIFKSRGYDLVTTEYINAYTPLKYLCLKHPDEEQEIRLSSLSQGFGCQYCSGNKKYKLEDVKNKFMECGYELLETEYKNNHTSMKYKCPYHPNDIQSITLATLLRGSGCFKCGKKNMATKNRTPFEKIKEEFTKRGYELLEDKYINRKTPMRYRCPKHSDQETKITYGSFILGYGCPYCSGNAKYTIEEARRIFAEYGFELLEEKYINNKHKMRYRCTKHPDYCKKRGLTLIRIPHYEIANVEQILTNKLKAPSGAFLFTKKEVELCQSY